MKRNVKLVFTLAVSLMLMLSVFSIVSSARFINEVGDISAYKIDSNHSIIVDGNIDTEGEIWKYCAPTVIDDKNSSAAWGGRSEVVVKETVRFAYSDSSLYFSAVIEDKSPVPSTGPDDGCRPHGFNGDSIILALDPLQLMRDSSNYKTDCPVWYCFSKMDDGSVGVYRSKSGNNGVPTGIIARCQELSGTSWSLETAIPWSLLLNDFKIQTFGDFNVREAQLIIPNVVHGVNILYADRYIYASPDMPDYTYMVEGSNRAGDIVTISRNFTPCNSVPGTSYSGPEVGPERAYGAGIYLKMIDHICSAGDWEIKTPGSCTSYEVEVRKCTHCQRDMETRRNGYKHDIGDWKIIKEPSCVDGLKIRSCKLCKMQIDSEIISAAGSHDNGYVSKNYTVNIDEKTGYKTLVCNDCSKPLALTADYISSVLSDCESSSWYAKAVAYMYSSKLMMGYTRDTFCPGETMTREQFVLIMANIVGADLSKYDSQEAFDDVPTGQWYSNAVAWAKAEGLTAGYEGNRFGLGDKITREQFLRFLCTFDAYRNSKDEPDEGDVSLLNKFNDKANISDWALSSTAWGVEKGLVTGRGNDMLMPRETATRAEASVMIMNYLTK